MSKNFYFDRLNKANAEMSGLIMPIDAVLFNRWCDDKFTE